MQGFTFHHYIYLIIYPALLKCKQCFMTLSENVCLFFQEEANSSNCTDAALQHNKQEIQLDLVYNSCKVVITSTS